VWEVEKNLKLAGDEMMTDKEMVEKIEQVVKAYQGDLSFLYEAIGMVVTGRLMGWRVMRLVSSNRCWSLATKLFGDPKLLMEARGKYYDKSEGMKIIDRTGEYWDYIKRVRSLPLEKRKSSVEMV
jgi:hypothetical protein